MLHVLVLNILRTSITLTTWKKSQIVRCICCNMNFFVGMHADVVHKVPVVLVFISCDTPWSYECTNSLCTLVEICSLILIDMVLFLFHVEIDCKWFPCEVPNVWNALCLFRNILYTAYSLWTYVMIRHACSTAFTTMTSRIIQPANEHLSDTGITLYTMSTK